MKIKIAILRFSGGIGNQFFQYYTLQKIAECSKVKFFVLFDLSCYDKPFFFSSGKDYYNQFNKYKIEFKLDRIFQIRKINSFLAKVVYRIAKSNKTLKRWLPIIINDDNIYEFENFEGCKFLFFCGVFVDKNLIKWPLLINFNIPFGPFSLCSTANQIENTYSVSIHIRGKQYVDEISIRSQYPELLPDYYVRAIDKIKSLNSNPTFFIFSNDLIYAQKFINALKIQDHVIFIPNDRGDDLDQFFLMSKCKCNIIQNSTFSYWAAVINNNIDKTIICPRKWAYEGSLYYKRANNLPLSNWIMIDN